MRRARTDGGFTFTLPIPPAEAISLFGGSGERCWGGEDWDPVFLHPIPERDEEGAVFLLNHGSAGEAVWMTTRWDPAEGRVQHVYVLPGVQTVQIDLRLVANAGGTAVTVRYRRTSLARAWDGHVAELGRRDPEQGNEWRRAVVSALARVPANPEGTPVE